MPFPLMSLTGNSNQPLDAMSMAAPGQIEALRMAKNQTLSSPSGERTRLEKTGEIMTETSPGSWTNKSLIEKEQKENKQLEKKYLQLKGKSPFVPYSASKSDDVYMRARDDRIDHYSKIVKNQKDVGKFVSEEIKKGNISPEEAYYIKLSKNNPEAFEYEMQHGAGSYKNMKEEQDRKQRALLKSAPDDSWKPFAAATALGAVQSLGNLYSGGRKR